MQLLRAKVQSELRGATEHIIARMEKKFTDGGTTTHDHDANVRSDSISNSYSTNTRRGRGGSVVGGEERYMLNGTFNPFGHGLRKSSNIGHSYIQLTGFTDRYGSRIDIGGASNVSAPTFTYSCFTRICPYGIIVHIAGKFPTVPNHKSIWTQ